MTRSKSIHALVSLLSLAVVACSDPADDGPRADVPGGEESQAEGLTIEGLTITHQDDGRVEGSFRRDGVMISFELSAASDGHRARIADAAGVLLVETTLRGEIEETSLLGGRARLRGHVDAERPELEGDPEIFQRMGERPETKLIAELKDALREAGVDRSLYSAKVAPSGAPGLETTKWLDVWGRWHLSCMESHDFPTWTFWGWTTIELSPEKSSTAAVLQVLTPWYNPPEYTGLFSDPIVVHRQYAGVPVRVANNVVALNGLCNHPLLVKVY
ncbi:MAG TPA: hypothetical protein VFS43_08600 [Polyangiaceae bacterium]|nr:hypothetical protein [Polyangiaceae bacterium]